MNLRKSLVTLFATIGLMVSLAAPAVTAQVASSDTAGASIVLNDTGQFFVTIQSDLSLGSHPTSASTAAFSIADQLVLVYTDTKSYRPYMYTWLSASDFNNSNASTINNPNTPKLIPASNFVITNLVNPTQTQCCSAQGIGGISNINAGTHSTNTGTADWSTGTYGMNGAGQHIHTVNPGIGTISTTAPVDVRLDVPAHMPNGIYSSLITVSVTTTAP